MVLPSLFLMRMRFDGFRSKETSLDKQSADCADANDIEQQVSSTVDIESVGSETKSAVVD